MAGTNKITSPSANPIGSLTATGANLPLKGQITSAVIAQNSQTNQSGRQVNIPLAAGDTIRINSAGNEFYLIIATAPVNIRPDGGDFVLYQQGTGNRQTSSEFKFLEVQNPNIVPIAISVWVGFDSFIDNRLIISNALTPTIGYPTQDVVGATHIDIPDLSGGPFADIDGNAWIAIQRVAILVFNTDSSTTLYLQAAGASTANGPAIGVIYPLTPVRFDLSGHYSISAGGGPIPAIVSELYIAIASNP